MVAPNKVLDAVIDRVAEYQDIKEALREIFNAGRDYERERIIDELAGTKRNRKEYGALSRYTDDTADGWSSD